MRPPKLPSINSLEGFALTYLLAGHRISHLSFQGDTNSYCLRAPIFNLRSDGWPIDDCWHGGTISRFSGRRTKYKKYFINDENLNALRQQFCGRLDGFIEAVNRFEQGGGNRPHSEHTADRTR